MADQTTPKKEPTASEAMFFFAIVKHTKNKADIDWHGVAAEQGFKNAEVAKVRFGQVKRKLGINSNNDGTPTPTKTPSKKTDGGTPTKVTKSPARRTGTKGGARGAGKGKVKKEEGACDEDTEMPPSPETPMKKEERGEDDDMVDE